MPRGAFLASCEETVTVSYRDGTQKTDQRIIILENRRPKIDQQGFITQELYYIGNIDPPNFNIYVNDQITRQPRKENVDNERGSSDDQLQVLTVEDIQVLRGKQQLQLRDRDAVR